MTTTRFSKIVGILFAMTGGCMTLQPDALGPDAAQPPADVQAVDAGQPPADTGVDAGQPPVDSGNPVDTGVDAGMPPVDSGTDAGTPTDTGVDVVVPTDTAVPDSGPAPTTGEAFVFLTDVAAVMGGRDITELADQPGMIVRVYCAVAPEECSSCPEVFLHGRVFRTEMSFIGSVRYGGTLPSLSSPVNSPAVCAVYRVSIDRGRGNVNARFTNSVGTFYQAGWSGVPGDLRSRIFGTAYTAEVHATHQTRVTNRPVTGVMCALAQGAAVHPDGSGCDPMFKCTAADRTDACIN